MRRLSDIVTITDVRMERIPQRVGWPLRCLCRPRSIGSTVAVAGYLSVSRESLAHLSRAAGFSTPMIVPTMDKPRLVA
jgi:acyl homoserine lactone synthase